MATSVVVIMTEREILLKKISTYQFAVLDLQLFLDTHPNDKSIIEKMREYKDALKPLVADFEKKYGPLTKSRSNANHWNWIKSPWPWESEDEN